jgi:hypothetical protein
MWRGLPLILALSAGHAASGTVQQFPALPAGYAVNASAVVHGPCLVIWVQPAN